MKASKIIRICTAAPILALVALIHLTIWKPQYFWDAPQLSILTGCLVVLPLLAYPLQPVIPSFKTKGREGQRTLAIIFAFLGYILALALGLIFHVSTQVLLFILVYLFSGLQIALLNFVFHIHASGHACGVVGPLAIMYHFIGHCSIIGAIVYILVWYSSLKMHRHKWYELVLGSIIPIISLWLALLLL